MRKLKKISILLVSFLVSLNLFGNNLFTIATAPTNGLFYPIGIEISKILKESGYKTSIQSTSGSFENIKLLIEKKAEMALSMSDVIVEYYNNYDKEKNLRCIAGLHSNYVQIITRKDTGIKTFKDLKGKKVGIGAINSGVEFNARMIYKAHDMTYADSIIDYSMPNEMIEKLKKGILDAVFLTNGIPNPVIRNLMILNNNISLVSLEKKYIKKLMNEHKFFMDVKIPKEVYGLKSDIQTVAVRDLLVTHKDLSEEYVYNIVKTIFENKEGIEKINYIVGEVPHQKEPQVSLKNSNIGVQIPFHKGAIKYYREKGLIK